jgi:hypothetical protein
MIQSSLAVGSSKGSCYNSHVTVAVAMIPSGLCSDDVDENYLTTIERPCCVLHIEAVPEVCVCVCV